MNNTINMEQSKTQRLLRLLLMLTGRKIFSIGELEDRLNISERTIYRYLDTIESVGLIIERLPGGYRLKKEGSQPKTLQGLLHFSEEEVYLLQQVIEGLEGSSSVHIQLLRKLHTLYDTKTLEKMSDAAFEKIEKLSTAIRLKQQVILHSYRSSNSAQISDRQVEPFEFSEDYAGLWCYEAESGQCKQFKLSRIQQVESLNAPWQMETAHKIPFTDAFRMAADQPIATIEANLTLKAYNLLIEEYPLAKQHITPGKNDLYLLKIPIADYHGIGRFVLGLPGEIEIIKPIEFNYFIKNQLEKFFTDRY